jgi:hypothetical protein
MRIFHSKVYTKLLRTVYIVCSVIKEMYYSWDESPRLKERLGMNDAIR